MELQKLDLTVLYVEDDLNAQSAVAEILHRRVRTVLLATNGQEGLSLYQQVQPDLVITDIQMPVMDGLKMAEEIKKINPDAQIIVTTAYSDSNYFIRSIDIGITRYVLKPILKEKLISAINHCTGIIAMKQLIYQQSENLRIANEKLVSRVDQAEAANLMKNQFLANISHEIRTPMNGILGFLDLLSDTDLSFEQNDYVSEAKSASETLLYLINDILDFSKIEAGKLLMESIPFEVRTSVEDALSLSTPKATEKGIVLRSMIHMDVPEVIEGDPTRLRQVLNNLIGNAVKFTSEGEITVTVETVEKHGDFARLRFQIRDTGIGIHEKDMGKLFQPFTQVDASTTRKYGGTGLGLAICRELVELMGGEITVLSSPGRGSTFSFTIQAKAIHENVNPQLKRHSLNEIATCFFAEANPRILLVEDNEMNQKVIARMLRNNYLICDVAHDGNEAIKAVSQKNYDIILMDCQMPVMDGFETTARIRGMEGISRHTVIVAMTANAMESTRDRCLQAGMNDYIRKPVSLNTLLGVIQKYIIPNEEMKNEDNSWEESI